MRSPNNDQECLARLYESISTPIKAWHGTMRPRVEKFHPFSHFGTLQAAIDRIEGLGEEGKKIDKAYFYEVALDIKSPVRVKDHYQVQDPSNWSLAKVQLWCKDVVKDPRTKLYEKGPQGNGKGLSWLSNYIKSGYVWDVFNYKEVLQLFAGMLRQCGIDGLVYKNEIEDAGSDAYVIFDPSQVHLLSARPKAIELNTGLIK